MPYLAFLVASGLGATGLVWYVASQRPRRAALAVLGATTAAVVYWLAAVPRYPDTAASLFGAVVTLLFAILLPGGAGAAVAYSTNNRRRLVGGLALMLALWLPLVFVGMFTVCQLDPRCDL